MDLSSLKVFFNRQRIKVQHWDYDFPKKNGTILISHENIKLKLNTIQQDLQNLINIIMNDPFYSIFEITHIIMPLFPDWVLYDKSKEYTIVILLRGNINNYNIALSSAILGY